MPTNIPAYKSKPWPFNLVSDICGDCEVSEEAAYKLAEKMLASISNAECELIKCRYLEQLSYEKVGREMGMGKTKTAALLKDIILRLQSLDWEHEEKDDPEAETEPPVALAVDKQRVDTPSPYDDECDSYWYNLIYQLQNQIKATMDISVDSLVEILWEHASGSVKNQIMTIKVKKPIPYVRLSTPERITYLSTMLSGIAAKPMQVEFIPDYERMESPAKGEGTAVCNSDNARSVSSSIDESPLYQDAIYEVIHESGSEIEPQRDEFFESPLYDAFCWVKRQIAKIGKAFV